MRQVLAGFMYNCNRMEGWGNNGPFDKGGGAFRRGSGHWQRRGYGFCMVVDRATDTPVGRSGILNHVGWSEPELAYHVFDNGEGHGYAYEAGVAVRQWAGRVLNLGPLVSIIAKTNTRSIALAKRLGAVAKRDYDHGGENATIYRHLPHNHPDAIAQVAA